MSTFMNAGSTMIILFFIVALGYLARKIHLVDDGFDSSLSKVILGITCPATILDSVLGNENLPDADVIAQVLGVSAVTYIPIIVLALVMSRLYRIPEDQRGGHAFTVAFGNTALIGFAVLGAIMGSQAVLYASVYNIVGSLLLYSVGAWMISRSGTVHLSAHEQFIYVCKNLFSPAMGACVLAFILTLLHENDFGAVH